MDKCTTPVEKLGGQVPVSIVRHIFPHLFPDFSTSYPQGFPQPADLLTPPLPRVIHRREVAPISASTESLKSVSDRFRELGKSWGVGWEEQEAVRRWREAVGESLAKLARPLYVERGVLHIAVASPVVAQELQLWSKELLARLAAIAPQSKVQALRFVIVPERRQEEMEPPEPTPKELNQAEDLVPMNLPSELRAKFVRILAQALAQEAEILRRGGHRCPRCGVAFLGAEKECPLCKALP